MTEQEWLECTDSGSMLEFLRGQASDRKLRLFAVACRRKFGDEGAFRESIELILEARRSAKADQCEIIREILGNPFNLITLNPTWLSSTVVSLAQAIYSERAFDRLPILVDALEECGCTSQDVLNHCRQPGDHVRGCWVTDLLLEKE